MVFVGLQHVKRGVNNAMMLSMVSFMENFICEKLAQDKSLDKSVLAQVSRSVSRLCYNLGIIIAYSYDKNFVRALLNTVGMEEDLAVRIAKEEAAQMVKSAVEA